MKLTKYFFAIALLSQCFYFNSLAANKTTELDQIFKSARDAIGSEKALQNIRNIKTYADCLGPEGSYSTEIHSYRTNKTYFKQIFSYKNEDTEIFINDSYAWETPTNPLEPKLISPFRRMVTNLHDYQKIAFDFQNMFSDFKIEGNETFEKRVAVKVGARNQMGGKIFLFFDKLNGRILGYVLPIPGTEDSVKNVFDEWKKVGKLNLLSKVTAYDKNGVWRFNFKKIEINDNDDSGLEIPPRIKDLVELLRLHKQHQTAHLTYDAELFISSFAESLPQLKRGRVLVGSKKENLARFKSYFSSFKFLQWEDINPPIIKISKDGTLATKIVEKRVRGTYKSEKGETINDHTVFAWLEVWEKIEGKWKVTTIASTSRAPK